MGLLGRKNRKQQAAASASAAAAAASSTNDGSSTNSTNAAAAAADSRTVHLLDPINHPTPDAPQPPPPPPSIHREHQNQNRHVNHNHMNNNHNNNVTTRTNHNNKKKSMKNMKHMKNNMKNSPNTAEGYLYAVKEYHNTIPPSSSMEEEHSNWTAAMKFTTSSEPGGGSNSNSASGNDSTTNASASTSSNTKPPLPITPVTPTRRPTPKRPQNASVRDMSTASSPGALEGSSVNSVVSNANFLYPSSSADARGGSSSEDATIVRFSKLDHGGHTNGGGGGGNGDGDGNGAYNSHLPHMLAGGGAGFGGGESSTGTAASHVSHKLGIHYPNYPGSPARSRHYELQGNGEEPEMVDDTYEETYGDAYIAAPIRYIYPSGYGSMQPRSRPWQISLVVCIGMSFMMVYIVGHCADQFEESDYYYYDGDEITDDVIIKTRWCGSRPLYFMWVLSVLITGFSCAYCSIIGYIKARDFAVANGRSQPPGMVGKSDYYVSVEDVDVEIPSSNSSSGSRSVDTSRRRSPVGGNGGSSGMRGRNTHPRSSGAGTAPGGRQKTLYQADGTPRYLGKHIYKPTQAAIHLTSR